MIYYFSKLSGPEFDRAMSHLFNGHRIHYEDLGWLQIRRKKTLVVICLFRYSEADLTQEIDSISNTLADLMSASAEFKQQMASLQLAIELADCLDQNRKQICTVYAAKYEDLARNSYDVKWPPSREELEAKRALRKKEERVAAMRDTIRSIPSLCGALLMLFCGGAVAYFSSSYLGSEIPLVAALFTVVIFGLVSAGSTVVEIIIPLVLISVPTYFIVTMFPRTRIIGIDIDIAVGPLQFLWTALIGLVLGLVMVLVVRFIENHFFD